MAQEVLQVVTKIGFERTMACQRGVRVRKCLFREKTHLVYLPSQPVEIILQEPIKLVFRLLHAHLAAWEVFEHVNVVLARRRSDWPAMV
jgi:hypothetical protein